MTNSVDFDTKNLHPDQYRYKDFNPWYNPYIETGLIDSFD